VGFAGVVLVVFSSTTGGGGARIDGALLILLAVAHYALATNRAVPMQQRYGTIAVIRRALLRRVCVLAIPGVCADVERTNAGKPRGARSPRRAIDRRRPSDVRDTRRPGGSNPRRRRATSYRRGDTVGGRRHGARQLPGGDGDADVQSGRAAGAKGRDGSVTGRGARGPAGPRGRTGPAGPPGPSSKGEFPSSRPAAPAATRPPRLPFPTSCSTSRPGHTRSTRSACSRTGTPGAARSSGPASCSRWPAPGHR
jgi:hypothetical protein